MLKGQDVDTVILLCTDNTVYLGEDRNGFLTQAEKRKDGTYHICGPISLASSDRISRIVSCLTQLLEPLWHKKLIFISPMPRYLRARCCEEKGHMPNWEGFRSTISGKLNCVAHQIKNRLQDKGWRNFWVLNPQNAFADLSPGEVWGTNPVHPKARAYQELASSMTFNLGLMEGPAEAAVEARGQKRPRSGGSTSQRQS